MVLFKENSCYNISGAQFGCINQKLSKKYIIFDPADPCLRIYPEGNHHKCTFKHLATWICIRAVFIFKTLNKPKCLIM